MTKLVFFQITIYGQLKNRRIQKLSCEVNEKKFLNTTDSNVIDEQLEVLTNYLISHLLN